MEKMILFLEELKSIFANETEKIEALEKEKAELGDEKFSTARGC